MGGSLRAPPPSSATQYFVADAEREVRVVIEEERGDVVVVDEEQDVGLLLGQPLLHRLVAGEDGRPHRVLLLVRIEREADGGGVRGGDAADDRGHGLLRRRRRPEYAAVPPALAREGRIFRVRSALAPEWERRESNRLIPRIPGTGRARARG